MTRAALVTPFPIPDSPILDVCATVCLGGRASDSGGCSARKQSPNTAISVRVICRRLR